MLPGVELARRRRLTHHHDDSKSRVGSSFHHHHLPRLQQPPATTMDETALLARRRLEEKLRGGSSSFTTTASADSGSRRRTSVSSGNQSRRSTIPEAEAQVNEMKGVLTLQRRSSKLQRQESQKEVCAICLDEFQTEQAILHLPCCHKYHSICLLPWLNSQSHCPCCRTHFHSYSITRLNFQNPQIKPKTPS